MKLMVAMVFVFEERGTKLCFGRLKLLLWPYCFIFWCLVLQVANMNKTECYFGVYNTTGRSVEQGISTSFKQLEISYINY